MQQLYSLLALYPSGIPRRDPPSCEAPREPTIYKEYKTKLISRLNPAFNYPQQGNNTEGKLI